MPKLRPKLFYRSVIFNAAIRILVKEGILRLTPKDILPFPARTATGSQKTIDPQFPGNMNIQDLIADLPITVLNEQSGLDTVDLRPVTGFSYTIRVSSFSGSEKTREPSLILSSLSSSPLISSPKA